MLELLYEHPELAWEDLERLREVFKWQWRQWRILKSRPSETEEEIQSLP